MMVVNDDDDDGAVETVVGFYPRPESEPAKRKRKDLNKICVATAVTANSGLDSFENVFVSDGFLSRPTSQSPLRLCEFRSLLATVDQTAQKSNILPYQMYCFPHQWKQRTIKNKSPKNNNKYEAASRMDPNRTRTTAQNTKHQNDKHRTK